MNEDEFGEIEITPEMIQAGVAAYQESDSAAFPEMTVRAVYEAMEAARHHEAVYEPNAEVMARLRSLSPEIRELFEKTNEAMAAIGYKKDPS